MLRRVLAVFIVVLGSFVVVSPVGAVEPATGRITGRARWSNFPRLRDGYAFPNCQGSIAVAEGAFVLFSMVGMSSLTDGEGVHVLMFRTEHEPHLWLNQVIAVGEGSRVLEQAGIPLGGSDRR